MVHISSVDDPVIKYVPEIAGRGLDTLTIRNLLRMDTGIRYRSEDDILAPFSDDALTYYPPDLRQVAFGVQPGKTPIGAAFHYNNFHPLLEGLIIERATGMRVAEYLQERIWKPMGAEFPASWSLDSEASGFEKMESGINARAVDYARFGLALPPSMDSGTGSKSCPPPGSPSQPVLTPRTHGPLKGIRSGKNWAAIMAITGGA